MGTKAKIIGTGIYIPEKALTNADLETMVDTTDEWIQTRTGIKSRHIAADNQACSDLAVEASKNAIKDSGLETSDIDLILVATITPDMFFPATACLVQEKIGADCPAFDISAACSGFPYALTTAESFIKSGMYRNILVVGAEKLSSFIDWDDRSTCVLFGDGAGAAVVTAVDGNSESGILSSYIGSNGKYADLLKIPGGGSAVPPSHDVIDKKLHTLKMEGKEIFKLAVRQMSDSVAKVLDNAGLSLEDIDMLIPHQANLRIIDAVMDRVKLPREKVFINLYKYGNMSSASTVVALHEAVKEGKIKEGSNVVMVAFGAGLTWAATVMKW